MSITTNEGDAEIENLNLFIKDTKSFLLKYINSKPNEEMKTIIICNIGRIIQSREINFLHVSDILDILNDKRTTLTMSDFRILVSHIKEFHPNHMDLFFECSAIQKLKIYFKEGDENFIKNGVSKAYDGTKQLIVYIHQGPILNTAFRNNNFEYFKALIENGVDSTMEYDGFEPVDFEIVKCPDHDKANRFFDLLNAYSLETIDSDGNTLLMAAIQNRFSVDGVEQILKELPRMSIQNNKKQNVFHIAASHENGDYLRYLVNMPIEHTHFYNQQDSEGNTPVHVAARESLGNINYFLVEGADLTIKNNEGDTALHVIIKRQENMATEMIRDIRTNVQKFCEDGFLVGDADGNTPLHLAVKRRMLNCIEYLSSASSKSLYVKNKEGLTPVELCAQMDDPEVFSFLKHVQAPPKKDDNQSIIERVDEEISWILLSKYHSIKIITQNIEKINFNDTDENGNTAFHLALMDKDCSDIARIYFEHIMKTKNFNILVRENNSGQVPIVLVNKRLHSLIYNRIFGCPGQTDEQKFECYLKNSDEYGINHILSNNKKDRKKFILILSRFGNIKQWNKYVNKIESYNLKLYLKASLQSNNDELIKYFIEEMKQPWMPISIIFSVTPFNFKYLKFTLKKYNRKNSLDNFAELAIKSNSPEAVRMLLSENFDPLKFADKVTKMSAEMMEAVFFRNLDKISKEVFFMTVKNKNIDAMRFCLHPDAKGETDNRGFCKEKEEGYNNTALNRLFVEWCNDGFGQIDMIEELVECGAEMEAVKVFEVDYTREATDEENLQRREFSSLGEFVIERGNYEALELLCEMGLNKTEDMLKALIEARGSEETTIEFADSLIEASTKFEDINGLIVMAINSNYIQTAQMLIIYALRNCNDSKIQEIYVQISDSLDNEGIVSQELCQALLKENSQPLPKENSQTMPKDNSQILLEENSQILLEENSQPLPKDNSQTLLEENSQPLPKDNSQILLEENSQILLEENSQALPKENSQTLPKDNSQASLKDNSQALLEKTFMYEDNKCCDPVPKKKNKTFPRQEHHEIQIKMFKPKHKKPTTFLDVGEVVLDFNNTHL